MHMSAQYDNFLVSALYLWYWSWVLLDVQPQNVDESPRVWPGKFPDVIVQDEHPTYFLEELLNCGGLWKVTSLNESTANVEVSVHYHVVEYPSKMNRYLILLK